MPRRGKSISGRRASEQSRPQTPAHISEALGGKVHKQAAETAYTVDTVDIVINQSKNCRASERDGHPERG